MKDNPIKQFIEESEKAWNKKYTHVDSEFFPEKPISSKYSLKDMKKDVSSQHLALLNVVKGVIEGKKLKADEDNLSPLNREELSFNIALDDIIKDLEIK